MSTETKPDDAQVGFKRPPKKNQFQPGTSGNPKGRPHTTFDFDRQVIKEFESLVTITENGHRVRVSKRELLFKQALNLGIKGNNQIVKLTLTLLQQASERKVQREVLIKASGPLELEYFNDGQLLAFSFSRLNASQLDTVRDMPCAEASAYIVAIHRQTKDLDHAAVQFSEKGLQDE